MYRNNIIAIVTPAFNEEKLLGKTIDTMPEFVDIIIVVNDGSTDNTKTVMQTIASENKKVIAVNNSNNVGVGGSLVRGFKSALGTKADRIGVMASDAQCDPNYISKLLDTTIDEDCDYAKANRFFHRKDLEKMPGYRKFGNIFISLLTKFSTGYYTISDTQNGYGFFRRDMLEKMDLSLIGQRYDYENTMLVALSIANAKVKDVAVPAIYGDETSTIKFLPTALRALKAVWVGFWRRMFYKYVLFGFHPIALFLSSGIVLTLFGSGYSIYMLLARIVNETTPTTATVMLAVLPIILGFQLLLTALTMDVYNERQ